MTLKQVLDHLKKSGTAQNRKTYGNHGVTGPMYGVSYAEMGKLSKKIGTDHHLALALWDSGNHDARILATFVADPTLLTAKGLDSWARDLNDYVLTGALSSLITRSPLGERKFAAWKNRKNEWMASAAWNILGGLSARPDVELSDDFCLEQLGIIQKEIHSRPNRVRHSMNQALISLGICNSRLNKAAVKAAQKIGRVSVDHGNTSCKTPDAQAYMAKTLKHRASQKGKK
jgi:3-methyladenine DNA glycosylase AlkD